MININDQLRIQGIEILREKTEQSKERLKSSADYEDYAPYLDGLLDGIDQVIKEITDGTLPDKFTKEDLV